MESQTPLTGEWEHRTETDDLLTGRVVEHIYLVASEQRGISEAHHEDITLVVRGSYNSPNEEENKLEAYIIWRDSLGTGIEDGYIRPYPVAKVAVRFDDKDIQEDLWVLSSNSEATFALNPESIVTAMKSANHFVAKVWRQDGTPMSALWNVVGFEDAIKSIEENLPTSANQLLQWRYRVGGLVGSPTSNGKDGTIVTQDGVVYFTTFRDFESEHNVLCALDTNTLELLWRYKAPSLARSLRVAYGVVFFVNADDQLNALDCRTGELLWTYDVEVQVSEYVIAGGVIYLTSRNFALYAVDIATGEVLWTHSGVDAYLPAVEGDVIYCSGSDGLLALDVNTGELRWLFEIAGTEVRYCGPPTMVDEVVFFQFTDQDRHEYTLHALSASTGEEIWTHHQNTEFWDNSLTVADGVIHLRSYDEYVYALDASTGEMLWRRPYAESVSRLAVTNGVVVVPIRFSHKSNYLYAWNATTGKTMWRYLVDGEGSIHVPPVAADGTVYFSPYDGYLYAVTVETKP